MLVVGKHTAITGFHRKAVLYFSGLISMSHLWADWGAQMSLSGF